MREGNRWKGYRWFVSLGLFVLLWHAAAAIFKIPTYLLPSPAVTVTAIVRDAGILGRHIAITLIETLAGLGMAVFAALAGDPVDRDRTLDLDLVRAWDAR